MPRVLIGLLVLSIALLGGTSPVAADRWYAETPVLGIVDAGRSAVGRPPGGRELGPRAVPVAEHPAQRSGRLEPGHLPRPGPAQANAGRRHARRRRRPGHARLGRRRLPRRRLSRPHRPGLSRSTTRATPSASSCCELTRTYKGRITTWVVWNEPDFLPGESGTWWTWSGNAADFYKLLKTAYRAIKEVDPDCRGGVPGDDVLRRRRARPRALPGARAARKPTPTAKHPPMATSSMRSA